MECIIEIYYKMEYKEKNGVSALRNKLKNRRKEYGYTQKSFAKELGMSKIGYTHIEQGLRFPREKLMKLIMEKLECDSMSLFENDTSEKRGQVAKNICKYMNELSRDKKYTVYHISAIRRGLLLENEDRKVKKIIIKNRTVKGKSEIYKRVAEFASRYCDIKITSEDVELFKKCTRMEYSNRTGKCTWSMPEVRKRLGYNPVTGY